MVRVPVVCINPTGQMVGVPVWAFVLVCIQSNGANSKRSSCLYPIQRGKWYAFQLSVSIQRVQMVGVPVVCINPTGQMVGVPVWAFALVCIQSNGCKSLYPVQRVQMVGVPVWAFVLVCIQSNGANSKRSSCLYPIQRVQMVGVPVWAFALVCINPTGQMVGKAINF